MSHRRDHCTGVPDWDIWVCCEHHDRAYELKIVSRLEADRHLFRCILEHGCARGQFLRYAVLASAYYVGVRACGWWFWKRAKPPLRRLRRRVTQMRHHARRRLRIVA